MNFKSLKSIFVVITITAFIIACKDANKEERITPAAAEMEQQNDNSPSDAASTSNTSEAATTPTRGTKLNPPHGEPGHRCDIAVGQPLPENGQSQQTEGNLNPPHGEPGHRCDIAVGAPLPN